MVENLLKFLDCFRIKFEAINSVIKSGIEFTEDKTKLIKATPGAISILSSSNAAIIPNKKTSN